MSAPAEVFTRFCSKSPADLEQLLAQFRDAAPHASGAAAALDRLLEEALGPDKRPFHIKCALFLLDPAVGRLRFAVSFPDKMNPQSEALLLPMDQRLLLSVSQQKEKHDREGYHLGWISPSLAAFGRMSLPIFADNEFLGALLFEPQRETGLNREEAETLDRFGRKLGALLDNRSLFRRVSEHTTHIHAKHNEALNLIYSQTIFSRTDIRGRIVDVNDAFCRISGYQRSELIGSTHRIINSGHHDPGFWSGFWSTVRSGKIWRGEVCNRNKNGELYWVDSIVAPMRDAKGHVSNFISVRFDITERKKGEDVIARFGRILDGSSDEIYIIDAQSHNYIQANAVACKNLGYASDELTRMTSDSVVELPENVGFNRALEKLARGDEEKVELEANHIRRDGSAYPVWIRLTYVSEETPPVYVATVFDLSEQKRAQAEIERLAYTDCLTGLPNRAATLNKLEELVWASASDDDTLSVLYLDLDRFKEVNDTRGHQIGDAVLKTVSARISKLLGDIPFFGRVGGDEFVVVLPGMDELHALGIAHKIHKMLQEPVTVDNEQFFLSASLGVTSTRSGRNRPEVLLRHADIAMYHAKDTMNGVSLFRPDMTRELKRKRDVAIWLRKTLKDNDLEFAFQPQVDLSSGALVGAEVLLRWPRSPVGRINPGEFIPIAEERGMMPKLGEWAFTRICRQVSDWKDAGLHLPGRLAFNISASQLTAVNLPDRLLRALKAHNLNPEMFELEITEHALMKDVGIGLETLKRLRTDGFTIAIDDFGTGYSSLSHLKNFAPDKLKIDLSFVRDMHSDDASYAIVSAIIAMADRLGMRVVAEGVEHERQARELRSLGCRHAQGFLYGKPISARRFLKTWLPRSARGTEIKQPARTVGTETRTT